MMLLPMAIHSVVDRRQNEKRRARVVVVAEGRKTRSADDQSTAVCGVGMKLTHPSAILKKIKFTAVLHSWCRRATTFATKTSVPTGKGVYYILCTVHVTSFETCAHHYRQATLQHLQANNCCRHDLCCRFVWRIEHSTSSKDNPLNLREVRICG